MCLSLHTKSTSFFQQPCWNDALPSPLFQSLHTMCFLEITLGNTFWNVSFQQTFSGFLLSVLERKSALFARFLGERCPRRCCTQRNKSWTNLLEIPISETLLERRVLFFRAKKTSLKTIFLKRLIPTNLLGIPTQTNPPFDCFFLRSISSILCYLRHFDRIRSRTISL